MRLYQKPSGLWAVDYVDRPTGERRRVSTGTRDKAEATRRARGIVAGTIPAPSGSPAERPAPQPAASGNTMGDLWDRCEMTCWHPREVRSQATISSNLRILRGVTIQTPAGPRLFADIPAGEVRYSTLEALVEALYAKGYAPGSVARKVHMVSKSLTMAAKWEVIPAKPPMPTIKADNKRTRIITDAEEPAIFEAVEARRLAEPGRDWKRYAALLRFLMDTGTRLGEALAVRDDWIEEVNGSWKLNIPANITKNGKARTLPLTPAIVETLPYLRLASADGRLFPMSAASAQYYWGNIRDDLALKGLDLSEVVLHTFRHTCLTRLAKRLPIHVVSKWAGHSDISITAGTYTHLDTEDLQAGVDVLSGK